MQTPETLRALGVNDRELIEQTIRTIYYLRSIGDYEGLLELVAEDVKCVLQGTWSLQTIPSPTFGKAAIAQALRTLSIDLEYIDYKFHELLIDGDRAAVHLTITARNRGAAPGVVRLLGAFPLPRRTDCRIRSLFRYDKSGSLEGTGEMRASEPFRRRAGVGGVGREPHPCPVRQRACRSGLADQR